MGLIPTPLFFQTLVGFLWLGRDSPVDSPSLKAMVRRVRRPSQIILKGSKGS